MKPVVLGIDTSGTSCSVALLTGAQAYARCAVVGNAHSKRVLAMVREVLSDASLRLDRCDVIAYAAGPGSFTGLRVACAVTQGLAFGAALPVVPVGTLDAIAHSAIASLDRGSGEILVAMDARMGEIYWTLSRWTEGRQVSAFLPALASAATLHHRLVGHVGRPVALGVGNAWSVHGDAMRDLVERVIDRDAADAADAVDVAHLGRIAYLEGKSIAPEHASPLYVRDDVALTTVEREAKRQAMLVARHAPEVEHGA